MMPFSTSTRISTPAMRSARRARARLCLARRASPAAPLAAQPTLPGICTVLRRSLLGLLGAAAIALPGGAHHSHGNYELTDFTHLEGTVREVHLINPHSWIFLEVPGEGDGAGPTLWAMEATTPVGLRRNGIGPDDVRPGDPIRVRCHRLRDGSDGCLLGFVTPLHGDPERGHGIEKEWD